MKPNGTPEPPAGCPLTPRTTSIRHVRELEIAEFQLPIDDDLLCEILPFAHSTDGDGIQWVAVRITVDLPGTPASLETCGWLTRPLLEQLPHLRELIRQAPSDLSLLSALHAIEQSLTERRHRQPSSRLRRSIKPRHGQELLAAWRAGRRPVLRTQAFFEEALPHLPEEHEGYAMRALQLLQRRELKRLERAEVIGALDGIIAIVGAWEAWPTSIDLESLNPFPDGYFDNVDLDDLFRDEDPEDPL